MATDTYVVEVKDRERTQASYNVRLASKARNPGIAT